MSDGCGDTHCVTCSDEGVPVRVLGAGTDGLASCVDERGAWSRIVIDLVGPVRPGDLLLAHAGVALARLEAADPTHAQRVEVTA